MLQNQNRNLGGNYKYKNTREKKRETTRESIVLKNKFDDLILEFQYVLFYKEVDAVDVFGAYNRAWVKWANWWNSDDRKVVQADVDAFYNYAIKQE